MVDKIIVSAIVGILLGVMWDIQNKMRLKASLADVKEFQEFKVGMKLAEIEKIAEKNGLTFKYDGEKSLIIINKDGERLGLYITKGKCGGMIRLKKQ